MTSTYTYIVDSNLTFMSSSKFKFTLLIWNSKQMNISWSVFIKRHRLKQNIIRVSAWCYFINQIYNFVNFLANFECIRIHLFADFALKSLPIERSDILVSCTRRLLLFLSKDPILQALEMNESYWTLAFTGNDKRICVIVFIAPAYSTLYLFIWIF